MYAGIDPDTRRRRYRTATVHGNRADAERGLDRLVAEVSAEKAVGSSSTVSELLEAWFAIAAMSRAPTTVRQTRSVLDRYLHPHLGGYRVGEVTPALIDSLYVPLRTRGSMRGTGLGPGSLARVHVVLRSALAQAQRWVWVWDNIYREAMRVAFCGGWVEGPNGPTLASTKTKRRHSVDLDSDTFEALVALDPDGAAGYVFSDDGGVTAWKPNRVTKTGTVVGP